jgi:hypothetical protein
MNKPSLAARRAELLERCAEQRSGLAAELQSLRPSNMLGHPVAGFVVGNKKLVMGALGAALSLGLLRRKRLLAIAGSAMSVWRTAQSGLALLSSYR